MYVLHYFNTYIDIIIKCQEIEQIFMELLIRLLSY